MLKKIFNLTFLICLGIQYAYTAELPQILVTLAPYKYFVEQVAGDTVQVHVMVPAGASAHTYEPTPRQMLAVSRAELWFQIGEPFEAKATRALQSHNAKLKTMNLRQGLNLIHAEEGHSCCHDHDVDPHFWLSARLAQTQAQTIADTLSQAYPDNASLYQANLKKFENQLKQLDQQIETILKPLKNRTILVSHPAYAYFCRDYDLKQYSIEFEGKDPTPQQLHKILQLARDSHIRTIFIQMQYNNKGARLIASQVGAHIVTLDPYAEDYERSMLEIAHAFAEG